LIYSSKPYKTLLKNRCCSQQALIKLFLCNRTRNEHFAYLKQAAKCNFTVWELYFKLLVHLDLTKFSLIRYRNKENGKLIFTCTIVKFYLFFVIHNLILQRQCILSIKQLFILWDYNIRYARVCKLPSC
jgi:hypothetical protein